MLITFEGPDGSGKTTALRTVAEALRSEGRSVQTTRQPGDSSLDVRRTLLEGRSILPVAELFLFLADRAQHVAEVIRPSLDRKMVVMCDRYADSTVVYQGHARGLDLDLLRTLNELATGGLSPNLTLLFDLPTQVSFMRMQSRDRLDSEPIEFHERVRSGFLEEARLKPHRWVIIDATKPPDEVAQECLQAVRTVLLA